MDYYDEINPYIIRADSLLKNLFFALAPFYKKEHGEQQDVTIPLFTTLHSTSESILILLLNQAIFDADVLLRTVMEGTIKYCYLMTGTDEERCKKYLEYKESLTEIDKLVDHKKAIEAIKILKEFSSNSIKPFELSVLSEDQIIELQSRYPKKLRTELKHRWSYQALLRSLAKDYPEYEAQLGSLSTYSLSSHFCHYDWTGVLSRQAQINGSADNVSEIYDVGHALRIISNILSMEIFRTMEYMRGNNYNSQKAAKLSIEAIEFTTEIGARENQIVECGK